MHIQEGTNTTLTTCTKMTEEVDRRHGVNGNSSKDASEEVPVHSAAVGASGGRLKFFKDGKFILELVRGVGREGERLGWVSVPRKTFWPPAAAPPTPPATHQPTTASLSVSDDNSSVQSSPWQRDHCWKQNAPRRNLSKELAVYYCRPAGLPSAAIAKASRRKRRRPHDVSLIDAPNGLRPSLPNGVCDKRRNGDAAETDGDDAVDGSSDCDREKYYHMKLKKPYQYHKLRVYKKTRSPFLPKELNRTIERLRERIAALPAAAPVNAKLANCRQEHMMVSPRKRILRELERVSLEDQSMKRRAKTVPALSTASYPPAPSPGPSHGPSHAAKPANGTGSPAARKEAPVSKNVSSYSIHSLLSMDERRSPQSHSHSHPPSLKTESPVSVHSPDLSPSPDSYRYRYGALTLGSPGQAPPRDSPTPPKELARLRYAPPAPAASLARQWAPPPPIAAPSPSHYRGSPGREEWPYVYGYGGYVAPLYRAVAPPPPLWMHYAPPGPWAPLPHPLLTDRIPKDEPTSDLPLNLSKH